jgi:hypothetical protein
LFVIGIIRTPATTTRFGGLAEKTHRAVEMFQEHFFAGGRGLKS